MNNKTPLYIHFIVDLHKKWESVTFKSCIQTGLLAFTYPLHTSFALSLLMAVYNWEPFSFSPPLYVLEYGCAKPSPSISPLALSFLFSLHYSMTERDPHPLHYRENRIQDKASAAVMSEDSYEADYEAYSLNFLPPVCSLNLWHPHCTMPMSFFFSVTFDFFTFSVRLWDLFWTRFLSRPIFLNWRCTGFLLSCVCDFADACSVPTRWYLK